MTKPIFIAALAFTLPLAACSKEEPAPAPAETVEATKAPAEMPPPIKSTKTYRCADNSTAVVDLFAGDKQAVLRVDDKSTPVTLKADEAGKPMTSADGWTITGDTGKLTITAPGKKAQLCTA